MANWLGKMADSAINFVGKAGEAIGQNPVFKGGRFFTSLFFGIPLGIVRLLVVDTPIRLIVDVAKIAHTRSFTTLWKGLTKTKIDPFYADLSEKAKNMTDNFVRGFMFGAWLDIANTAKGWMEDYQSENFGTSKTPGAVNSTENIAATQGKEAADRFVAGEIRKVSNSRTDGMAPNPIFTPKSASGPISTSPPTRGRT